MRKLFLVLGLCLSVLGIAMVTSTASLAGELKTITLSVDKMTCNMCPITVKKALRKVEGVSEVKTLPLPPSRLVTLPGFSNEQL